LLTGITPGNLELTTFTVITLLLTKRH